MLYLLEENNEVGVKDKLLIDKELWTYFEVLNLIKNVPGKPREKY